MYLGDRSGARQCAHEWPVLENTLQRGFRGRVIRNKRYFSANKTELFAPHAGGRDLDGHTGFSFLRFVRGHINQRFQTHDFGLYRENWCSRLHQSSSSHLHLHHLTRIGAADF